MGTKPFFAFEGTRRRMYEGPLGPYIDEFISLLREQGYLQHSIRGKVRVIADFSRWLDDQKLGHDDAYRDRLKRFLAYRKCTNCSTLADAAALREMADLLRRKRLTPTADSSIVLSERRHAEERFRNYLLQDRGLSRATLNCYMPVVSWFLRERFGDGPVQCGELIFADITAFIRRHAHGYSHSRAQTLVTALRAFLRYLRHRGQIAIDLAAGVPAVASWSSSKLPIFLRPDQVNQVLHHCDRKIPIGRRDYAVLLLLARLGLRAGEVAALTLDEIDWERGSLTIRSKGGRWTQMPLPQEVGEAIADYVTNGRPSCTDRRVFIRHHAPRIGFSTWSGVSVIASRALARAGIDSPRLGAHIFRHALGTQMLRQGASLSQIGQLLRHQHPDTTRIYAKVDVPALRTLALPWPGGVK